MVFCPRDQGGSFGVVGKGACNVGGLVVVCCGVSCENSSHSTSGCLFGVVSGMVGVVDSGVNGVMGLRLSCWGLMREVSSK